MLRKTFVLALAALSLLLCQPTPAQQPSFATGSITTQNLVPAGAATTGSAVELFTPNAAGVAIQVTGTYTGALSVQVTNDGTNWVTLAGATVVYNVASAASAATITSAQVGVFAVNTTGVVKTRVTALAAVTGTAVVTMRTTAGSRVTP